MQSAPTDVASIAAGEKTYAIYCQSCHGANLAGTAVARRMMRFFHSGSQLTSQAAGAQIFPDLPGQIA